MAAMTDKLRAIMALDPAREEIDFEGVGYRWAQIASVVAAIELLLDSLSLPSETRIGVMLRNRPGHVAAICAVLGADRCLVSLNPILPDVRLQADVDAVDVPVIIGTADDLARVTLPGAGIVIGSLLDGAILLPARAPLKLSRSPGVAIEMLTSGTTGAPKRVPLSRAAFDASFAGFTRYERGRDFADAPRLRSGVTMVVNPLTHIGGIYGCIGALMAGRKIALLERFTVEGWVAAIKRNQPRVAPAVPSAIKMILDADIPKADLASLSALISGTAPLDPAIVDAFYARYDIPILANYGATEFAGAIAGWNIDDFRAHWTAKRGSVGRVHADIDARIADADADGEGILELKGAQLGNGDVWLRTTDRAMLDADGFLFIRGRSDNAIIRGGFKVHPDDVVKALHEHPAVREAAVVGIADARLGAVPAAAIVLREGVSEPDDLVPFLRERLLPYQVPVRFRTVADLPRTPSMKPSLPDVQALFA